MAHGYQSIVIIIVLLKETLSRIVLSVIQITAKSSEVLCLPS